MPRALVPGPLLCSLLVVSACAQAPTSVSVEPVGPTAPGVVVAHVDGDTLVVRVDGNDETVRLIGIDTPETHRPGTPVECYGPEASARLAELAPLGTALAVETDAERRDRYHRLLAHLHRSADGTYLNAAMVAEGFAAPLHIEPNSAHTEVLDALAAEARGVGAGLWSACGGPHELPR